MGKYKEAIECFSRALEIDPENAEAWYNKGNTLYNMEKYKEAIECYDKVIKIDPVDTTAWYNKALIYSLLKDRKNTLQSLDQLVKLNKKYEQIVMKDKNFANLWDDDDFKRIVS